MSKVKRNVYLSNMEIGKATELFTNQIEHFNNSLPTETVSLPLALGRISAHAMFAKISSPHYNAAAMDGISLNSEVTIEADETNPIRLKKGTDFIYIDTGDPLKSPHNAVIMIEDVVEIDSDTVEIVQSSFPWQHVRPIGEDIVQGEMIIPGGHKIRPVDIGAMISSGHIELEVVCKPKVGIIPTGTEIIDLGDKIEEGKIIDSNSRVFEALVKEMGGIPNRYKAVIDDYNLIKEAVSEAVKENDIVIINAGSSAGTEDYTSSIVSDLGELIVHGVAIKPGKPTILGNVDGKPVIGLPGYPVSSYIVFDNFVKPLISKFLNQLNNPRQKVKAVLSRRIMSSLKHEEFVRMKLGQVDEKLIATPLNRGAGVTMSLVRADGILRIPQSFEGYESGEEVEIELFKSIDSINNTLVAIGSHDIMLDILANELHKKEKNINFSSAHVGSLAGIMSIRKGEAHIAPVHLLDESTGEYNLSYISRYLKGMDLMLIKGIKRTQGFMVSNGNPKNIKTFEDLKDKQALFVNRQKGSGTRVLFDYKLKEKGIEITEINGYEHEMTTHMMIASAVKSASVDVGMGIQSAANSMDLDFIPVGVEDYDFIVPQKYINDDKVKAFIEILRSEELRTRLKEIGGYEVADEIEIIEIKS